MEPFVYFVCSLGSYEVSALAGVAHTRILNVAHETTRIDTKNLSKENHSYNSRRFAGKSLIHGTKFCACKSWEVDSEKTHEHHQKPRNAAARHLSDPCWNHDSLSRRYPRDRDRHPGAGGGHFDFDRQVRAPSYSFESIGCAKGAASSPAWGNAPGF